MRIGAALGVLAVAFAAGPAHAQQAPTAALNQITSPTAPMLRTTPVMRLAIERTEVSCGR